MNLENRYIKKITTPNEAKELIIKGLLKLADMDFDYLGIKESNLFKMTFPDSQKYEFGIDLSDLITLIEKQFPEEI